MPHIVQSSSSLADRPDGDARADRLDGAGARTHSALKIGVRGTFVLGLCFSKHGYFSFKKHFYL